MMAAGMVSVTIENLSVTFGEAVAVDRANLSIAAGELFLLLGPSGCGKTTLLRAIAGFTPASAGVVRFGAEDVTRLPAHERNVGLVFQSFALWPHLTVAENVAFGLRERRVARAEIATRVEAALESTRMKGYGPRRIDELSGGEQQRVALARALVVRPRCLLLDEPLSNLDARLRHSMRDEIRSICKEFGLTAIYVTHDQKEALAIADRVAVMEKGRILQVGAPAEVYRRPASRAVATFVGDTNLLAGRVSAADAGALTVETAVGAWVSAREPGAAAFAVGAEVWISVRPECFRAGPAEGASPRNTVRGACTATVYLGELAEHRLRVGETTLSVFELNPAVAAGAAGVERAFHVAPGDVVVLPVADEGPAPAPRAAGEPGA
jgi:iron(III) transport system ATP-binding protein